MTETTSRTPVEVDSELAEVQVQLHKAQAAVESAWTAVHQDGGDRRKHVRVGRKTVSQWQMSNEEAHEALRKVVEAPGDSWYTGQAAETLNRLANAQLRVSSLEGAKKRLESEYTGWSRFFLVTSSAGHIHSSMSCSTCQWTTEFAWLPELSGRTEADAVAEHGALLCSVCFPSAPVEWTNFYEVQAAEKAKQNCPGSGQYAKLFNREHALRVSKYAECHVCGEVVSVTSAMNLRAHKAKAAGEDQETYPLKVKVNGSTETFKTERSAVVALVGHLADHQQFGYRLDEEAVELLMSKTGVSEEDLAKKVAAKVKRYQAEMRKFG